MILKQVVEALVFASQKPLLPKEIVAALRAASNGLGDDADFGKTKEAEVAAALEELKADYMQSERSFQLREQASGWQLVTNPDYAQWVRQLYPESKPARLSGPALETLAIIAYRQPITRADIEAVRGVAVDGMVQSLLERGFIKIAGRADVPGRPLLYETTQVFLEHFGLKELDELPNSQELKRINLPTAPVAEPAEEKQMTLGEAPAVVAESSEAVATEAEQPAESPSEASVPEELPDAPQEP